jgi:hypothetical protein
MNPLEELLLDVQHLLDDGSLNPPCGKDQLIEVLIVLDWDD